MGLIKPQGGIFAMHSLNNGDTVALWVLDDQGNIWRCVWNRKTGQVVTPWAIATTLPSV